MRYLDKYDENDVVNALKKSEEVELAKEIIAKITGKEKEEEE